jgi:pimeloyl-ACP methyl ester carboxylesterase
MLVCWDALPTRHRHDGGRRPRQMTLIQDRACFVGAHVREDFAVVDGLRLHYRAWGDPARPTVLLLHGLTGNAWEWDPVAAVLAERLHVVAVNQRGHGASARATDYSAQAMVADLEGVTATLGIDKLAVAGHSMGALNAYLFASRNPGRVERLAIVDFGPASLTAAAVATWTASLQGCARRSYAEPGEALIQWRSSNPRTRPRELERFVSANLAEGRDGRWRWRFDAVRLHTFFESVPSEEDQWAGLREVDCPTLVIRGEDSVVLSAKEATRIAAAVPDGDVLEIANAAHDLTVEQPLALARALESFLARPVVGLQTASS